VQRDTIAMLPHPWSLYFDQAETFPDPIPYSGLPAYFYINTEVARQLPPRYTYHY
jgi:hypothetical protein